MCRSFQRFAIAFALLVIVLPGLAQMIPADRSTDWGKAGLLHPPPEPTHTVDITAFGGAGDGVTPNGAALTAAFAAVHGEMGVVYFPPGNYLFTQSVFLPDSVILRGAGAELTTITLSLGGAGQGLIAIGHEDTTKHMFTQGSAQGDTHVWSASTSDLEPGDEIRLYRNDSALVVSWWAIGTAGQLANVVSVNGADVEIAAPLRASYPLSATPYFRKVDPVQDVGIECLKIVRTDAAPPDEWSNIHIDLARNCWVHGVESDHCNFAHIELFASTNCEISGCHLHHAFSYGGDGEGYGVVSYFTSGENLIYDNIFQHVRHAMIVFAGANGNVFAYNRSLDPYWNEGIFPTNAAGDIVLHGDQAYMNLFEGNVVQNIAIDDSHGKNGPFNTFFRNRAGGWGLVMSASPATDSVNFVGNEIIGSPGLNVISGVGHFTYGENVQGTITPAGTDDLMDASYYATEEPAFLAEIGGWPQIGPNSVAPGTIPAALRYTSGTGFTVCPAQATGITHMAMRNTSDVRCWPMPFADRFLVEYPEAKGRMHMTLRDPLGAVVLEREWSRTDKALEISGCGGLRAGVYLLELRDGEGRRFGLTVLKQ